jgi:hypothetical protein
MNINVGDRIVVIGISLKGKNRVKEFGDEWEVTKIANDAVCLLSPGPFLFVEGKKKWFRWISKENDFHFKIIAVQPPLFPLDT